MASVNVPTIQEEDEHTDDVSQNFLDEVKQASTPHIETSPCHTFLRSLQGWRLYIIDTSIRKKLAIWVIIQILIQKIGKEPGSQDVVCLLKYLHKEVVNKVQLLALCVCLGMLINAKNNHIKEASVEVLEEAENREIQEVEHVTITFQENQEIEEVHENQHGAPTFEEISEILDVKEEKSEEDMQLLKRRSDWWVNTRNVMAMVAIFLATVSITASFTPPANVLDVKVAAIFFTISIHICLMVSLSVLFFLFGVTATSPITEKRILQLANLGLWISFFSLTVAYLVNMWVSVRYIEIKICLTISTCVGFGLLSSLLFSSRLRSIFGGVRVLKGSVNERPYILYELFKVQKSHVVKVEV